MHGVSTCFRWDADFEPLHNVFRRSCGKSRARLSERWAALQLGVPSTLAVRISGRPILATYKHDQHYLCTNCSEFMTMTMTMTHSEKSHIGQMRAWPYRQECRGHGPTKKNLSYR